MIYHVIIALNSTKKRRVGQIISVLERKELELLEIRKKTTSSRTVEFPGVKKFVLMNQISEQKALEFYYEKFPYPVLERKFKSFLRNHVELFFESEEIIDPDELWNACRETFESDRKVPILLVIADRDENGEMKPFIPTF